MAHDRKRVRTVVALLRSVMAARTPQPRAVPARTVPARPVPARTVSPKAVPTWMCVPMARRLLVVMAVAAGGWLLGGAGHAHAQSLPQSGVPGADPRTAPAPVDMAAPVDVAEAVDVTEGMARRPHPERWVRRSPAGPARSMAVTLAESLRSLRSLRRPDGRPAVPARDSMAALIAAPGVISQGRGAGRLARDLRAARQAPPLRSSTVLGAPVRVWRAVGDFASVGSWTAGRLPGLPWTPRPRVRAGAGTGERTGARVPGRIAATGASKDGRAAAGTEMTLPAAWPDPGSQPAPVPRGDALMTTAGPALTGGAVACLSRTRPGAHARTVPVSWSGFGTSVARSSSDEPAFSPD